MRLVGSVAEKPVDVLTLSCTNAIPYNIAMAGLRIAFLILAHSDPSHLERLCCALRPHSVFIHVDRKSVDFPFDKFVEQPGVSLIKPSIKIHWGDFSMIEATLALIERARSAGPFDRYVLLSGSCYPVKSMAALEAAFEKNPHSEWVNLTQIRRGSHLAHLIGRRWRMAPLVRPRTLNETLKAVWNKISGMKGRDLEREIQMTPYYGSQWWALTDDCTGMIMEFVKSHPEFVKAYRSVYAPDEHFFHTIVGNSNFAASARQVEDSGSLTNKIMPFHLTTTAVERDWGLEDQAFAAIAATDQFFIRKISTNRSAALVDRIDAELLRIDSSTNPVVR